MPNSVLCYDVDMDVYSALVEEMAMWDLLPVRPNLNQWSEEQDMEDGAWMTEEDGKCSH